MTPDSAEEPDRRLPSRVMADDLRHQIETGVLAPGDVLPSERVLAQRYGTARNTAREAFRLLAESGLVTPEHGRGVFVRAKPPLIRMGNDRYSRRHRESGLSPWRNECVKQGKEPRTEVLSVERVVPPADVAERLGLSTRTKSVVRRENVFYADDEPMHRVTTFIPWKIAKGTGLIKPRVGNQFGIYGVLEDQGHQMTRLQEEVSARMPTPDERMHLALPAGVPVLDVLHTSFDQNGEPYELTRFVSRADLTGLLYTAPVD